jgi:hypothetical protein
MSVSVFLCLEADSLLFLISLLLLFFVDATWFHAAGLNQYIQLLKSGSGS